MKNTEKLKGFNSLRKSDQKKIEEKLFMNNDDPFKRASYLALSYDPRNSFKCNICLLKISKVYIHL